MSSRGKTILFSGLSFLFIVLFVFAIIRVVNNSEIVGFTSLLDYVRNCPFLDFSMPSDLSIYGDWGIIDFLRNFLNLIISVFNFLVWLCKCLFNSLSFCIYFVRYLFV